MNAWRNGNHFVFFLKKQQDTLKRNISQVENKISLIKNEILQCQDEQDHITQQISLLTPSGILTRAEIYKGIRQQGLLLTQIQMVIHKITQLEDEQYQYQDRLELYQSSMQLLDKRFYKLTTYINKEQRLYFRRREKFSENEILEMAIYDRKKI